MPPNRGSREGSTALPPRLRVLVKGNSTAINVGPVRRSRSEGTYPEMLERLLRREGVDAEVTNDSTAWSRITKVFPDWFEELAKISPDVVVVNFGGAESQAHIFPTWLIERMQRRRSAGPLGPIRGRFARLVDSRIRQLMGRTIRFLSPRLKIRTWRVSPARFEVELERLIRVVRGKTSSLVLAMTVSPATPTSERLWWNLGARNAILSEVVRDAVKRVDDPQVRLIDLQPIHDRLGPTSIYDGFHWSVQGHEAIAEQMCAEILRWMADAGI
jgi:lysophospholipase L1-like esterase